MAKSLEQIFGKKKSLGEIFGSKQPTQEFQPLTEEQKAFTESEVQRIAPDKTAMGEVKRGLTNIRRDVGAVLPFEGLQEKGEALQSTVLGKDSYAENLSAIRQDKAQWDKEKNITLKQAGLPTWTDEALEIVGGISTDVVAGNALGISKKLATLGAGARRGLNALIGATEAGTLSNTPLGYAIGGTLGLIAPELAELGIKGIKKGAGAISDTAGEFVGKLLKQTGGQDIADIASDDKTMSKVIKGIDASKQTAGMYREISDQALEETYDRTQRKVSKALGVDDIAELGAKAKKQYQDTFTKFKGKKINKNIYDSDVLKDSLATARKNDLTGELADLGDNTLGVAQSVKESLDDRIANSYVSKGLAKPQATKETRQLMQIRKGFVDKLDNVFSDYKQVRTDYGKFKQSQNLIDDILKPRGKEDSNLSSLLLTNKNKATVRETLGEDKLKAFTKTLREEDNIYKNLRSISTKARNRVQDRNALTKRLEKSILSRDIVAPIAVGAVTSPAIGATVLGGELAAGIGSDIFRSNVARGLVKGTEQLDPFVQTIMARQLGGIGQ